MVLENILQAPAHGQPLANGGDRLLGGRKEMIRLQQEQYDRINKFHAHLDICEQCRKHPFDLCEVGAKLLKEAAVVVEE